MKTLSQVFNDESRASGQDRPFRTLSADGGTNIKDATGARRLEIMNLCGKLGKVLRGPDGRQLTSNDIMAMPLDDLEALFKATPADPNCANQSSNADTQNVSRGVGDGTQPVALMAAVFNAENACLKLLSVRFDSSRDAAEDALRLKTIRSMITKNRIPLKEDGFTYFSESELLAMAMPTLRTLAVNSQKTVRCL